jgi:transposase
VRQLIRSAGAKLFFLPKYSPDLNPIEQLFAELKHLIRKAAEPRRVFRRPFGLSYAAMAGCSSMA